MRNILSPVVAVLALAMAACGGSSSEVEEEEASSTEDEIVAGGRSGPEDDAVVHVYSGVPCTGVLVTKSIVLTALHCVARGVATASAACSGDAAPLGALVPPTAVRVSVGSKIYDLDHYDVRAIVTRPSRRMCNGDMAALVLSTPVRNVAPRKVRTSPLRVGQRLTAVGWGGDGVGRLPDFRRRRTGIAVLDTGGGSYTKTMPNGTVRRITSGTKEIVTGESICQGDSGGPLFDANGAVAAIVSRVQAGCVNALSVHSDVSYWDDLLDDARAY